MKTDLLVFVVIAIGVLAGVVTRPTHWGIQTPLDVLFSSHPADRTFRSELTSHLVLTATIGAVAGGVVAAVMAFIKKA